ncbi:MAG: hypothetical protein QOG12_902 [Verrucomicrobiota bacterium]
MANCSFESRKIMRFLIGSGILIFVSLVAIIWGLRLVIAHGGVQGASLAALYAIAFGFCALIISVIVFYVFRSQHVACKRMRERGSRRSEGGSRRSEVGSQTSEVGSRTIANRKSKFEISAKRERVGDGKKGCEENNEFEIQINSDVEGTRH